MPFMIRFLADNWEYEGEIPGAGFRLYYIQDSSNC